ncbi:uncharacterized protein LOC144905509 [Branchiostoma floridae x Branchiostoma belcheri]
MEQRLIEKTDINSRQTADAAGAWAAATNNKDQWLMRDLGDVSVITGVITKGRNGIYDQYVTSYVISYGNENGDEKFYTNAGHGGRLIVFPGNHDRDTGVINNFRDYSGPITARFIKIHPRTWHGHISMRAKIVTEPPSWSASSEWDSGHSAHLADINSRQTADAAGAWAAATNNKDQWLMRDLGDVSVITGVITKGRNGIYDQYVTSYVISYGNENGDEKFYTNAGHGGRLIVFPGNHDRDTGVINNFRDYSGPITARFIKIHPRTWHGHISMRAKIVTEPPSWSASSEWDSGHSAHLADINSRETADAAGAWAAATNNKDQWLMRDLGDVSVITGVITKGRNYSPDWPGIHDQYVTSYVISYGNENGDENFYTNARGEVTVFPGNHDRDTGVINNFRDYSGPITARFIKIHPRTWHGHISMRAKIVTVKSPTSKEGEINVSLNKAASQSSLYWAKYSAERAVDGNTGTTLSHLYECTHTNLEYQPWWKVDLGDTYVINHVTVINRGDCCGERLKDFMIRVGHNKDISKNEQCGDTYTDIPEDGAILDIQCTTPMSGRWVSVQLSGRRDYLSLCEVQVFSTSV